MVEVSSFMSQGCKNNLALVLKDRDDKTRFDSQKAPIELPCLENLKITAFGLAQDALLSGHRVDRGTDFL